MRHLISLSIVLSAFFISGCGEATSRGYIPSSGPLVLTRFDSLLESNGIRYNKDTEGYYIPLASSDFDSLVDIGSIALDVEPSRMSVRVDSECAGNGLKAELRKQEIFFADTVIDSDPAITVTKSDGEAVSLTALYASAKFDCM